MPLGSDPANRLVGSRLQRRDDALLVPWQQVVVAHFPVHFPVPHQWLWELAADPCGRESEVFVIS